MKHEVKIEQDLKETRTKLSTVAKSYESLKTMHDQEVRELFENKYTLKFIKQMKHYKEEWKSKPADDERKRIATQMASSTKNWVSATDETVVKEEKGEE